MTEVLPPPRGHLDPVLDLAGLTRPHWQARAACRGRLDIEWFPGRGESSPDAIALCSACEVRADCLEFALTNLEKFGIWGGLPERRRRRIRMARRAALLALEADQREETA